MSSQHVLDGQQWNQYIQTPHSVGSKQDAITMTTQNKIVDITTLDHKQIGYTFTWFNVWTKRESLFTLIDIQNQDKKKIYVIQISETDMHWKKITSKFTQTSKQYQQLLESFELLH